MAFFSSDNYAYFTEYSLLKQNDIKATFGFKKDF